MGEPQLPTPLAEGNLRRTPFAHVLLYVLKRGLDGTLVIWPSSSSDATEPSGQERVRFVRGHPVAGRLSHRASTLDRSLLPLFRCADAPYAFYHADLVGTNQDVIVGQINSLKLITASLRGAARDDAMAEVLERFRGTSVRIQSGFDIDQFGFDAKEMGFINFVLAAPGPIDPLIADSGNPRIATRLLYLLAITKALEPFEPTHGEAEDIPDPNARPKLGSAPRTRPSVGLRSKPPTDWPPEPPMELDDEQLARWEEIRRKVKVIERQTYFEMLGVDQSVTAVEAQSAYFTLVKKWHPDRLPEELQALRPFVDRVFYYLTQAKDALTDDVERREHLRLVEQGGGTPESDRRVSEIVQAALEYQKAEVLFRRRDYHGALEIVEVAKELNPEESDYHALEAWLLFHMHAPEGAPYERMLDATDKALKLRDTNDKAHFYRGMILKRSGDGSQALVHFKKAADLNQRNVDAVREVRLATMRRRRDSGSTRLKPQSSLPPPTAGLLSKIFGSVKKK